MRWPEREAGVGLRPRPSRGPFELEAPPRRARAPTAPAPRHVPLALGRARGATSRPSLQFLRARASASSSRRPTPSASGICDGDRVEVGADGTPSTRRWRCAPRCPAGSVFLRPTARSWSSGETPLTAPSRRRSWRCARRDRAPLADGRLLRALVDPDHQGARDLRRRAVSSCRSCCSPSASCSAASSTATAPTASAPSASLQPIADIGKLLTKEQFRPRTSIGWLFALAPVISIIDRGRRVRDHPVRRRRRHLRHARSGSTASTSRSARCTCSRSARSPSTG